MRFLIWLAAGLAGGVLGGMGLGGGTLLIPLMTMFAHIPQKTAAAINLMGFVPMAAAALVVHAKNGLLQKDAIAPIALPAGAVCALFSLLACGSDDRALSRAFGIFLAVLGIFMLLKEALSSLKAKATLVLLAAMRRDLVAAARQKMI